MNRNDLINGSFEMVGGVLLLKNCWVLYCDKIVRGVSVLATTFFSIWGVWNLYFYGMLDQWFSFLGGLVIASANLLWVWLALYYGRRGNETTLGPSS